MNRLPFGNATLHERARLWRVDLDETRARREISVHLSLARQLAEASEYHQRDNDADRDCGQARIRNRMSCQRLANQRKPTSIERFLTEQCRARSVGRCVDGLHTRSKRNAPSK